jgi:hypothetical protein
MGKRLLLVVVSALSALMLVAGTSSAVGLPVSPPAPPTPGGVLIVSFYGPCELDCVTTADLKETFQRDLLRIASRLPLEDVGVSGWIGIKVLEGAYVGFSVRGDVAALDVTAGRLIRAVEDLPYVRLVFLRGNGAEPDAGISAGDVREDGGTSHERGLGMLRFVSLTPNPSRSGAILTYDVPAPGGRLWVKVFDVAGRLMAEPFAGDRLPGVWTTRWDAKDSGGCAVPAGVYLIQVQMAGQSLVRRIALAR